MPDVSVNQANSKSATVSAAIDQKYFPSLNGLRGISIIIVIMAHIHLSWNITYLYIFNGPLGVNIFFVLSGFLITTLCLKEQRLTGNLSLKSFYLRRILRIVPVAYLYIACIFILDLIFHFNIIYYQYLGALCYVMNFSFFRSHHETALLAHFWSVSIEEQFYIIFPFILKKNQTVFYWSLLFIIILLPVLCSLQEIYQPLNKGIFYLFTHYLIKFQSIAIGCLLALLASRKLFDGGWLLSYKTIGNLMALVVIFSLRYDPSYNIKSVYINLIISILTGYIILSNLIPGNDVIYKVLNSGTLSFIGILSYSLYIWQQIFTFGDLKLPAFFFTTPFNLVFLALVSCLSYFVYEKYFLRLKSAFSVIKGS